MVKLYSRESDRLQYWEAWEAEDIVVVDRGTVGDRGETEIVPIPMGMLGDEVIRREVHEPLEAGFWPEAEEEQARIMVHYPPDRSPIREKLQRSGELWKSS
jgi:hypothetical protein